MVNEQNPARKDFRKKHRQSKVRTHQEGTEAPQPKEGDTHYEDILGDSFMPEGEEPGDQDSLKDIVDQLLNPEFHRGTLFDAEQPMLASL